MRAAGGSISQGKVRVLRDEAGRFALGSKEYCTRLHFTQYITQYTFYSTRYTIQITRLLCILHECMLAPCCKRMSAENARTHAGTGECTVRMARVEEH
jgi:hypothetical protein